MNTNKIIDNIKKEIQDTIDLEQRKLDNITVSFEKAQQFLLDNGYSELNDDDDVLIDIMKCIKSMKHQMKINDEDIKNIEKSIKSLEGLKNSIDKSVIENLQGKIKIIKGYNETSSEKLKESKVFLESLLSLEILCPVCNSKIKSNNQVNTRCSYCEGSGIVNISKILDKESLLEVDYVKPSANNELSYKNSYNSYDYNYSVNNNQQQKEEKKSNTFIIRKS